MRPKGDLAIYIPDNDRLLAVLDGLPSDLRRYSDHAALLIYFTAVQGWRRRQDEDEGPSRLHSLILRKYIPSRAVTPLRKHLQAQGVLVCESYSAGHYSTGYRLAPAFDGLPLRRPLSNNALIDKWRAWKRSTISTNTPEMREVAQRRRPITDSMTETLDGLRFCASPGDVETQLRGRGIDPAHLRYACAVIGNVDHDGICMDEFGWRVHSILTNTTATIRPFLRLDGDPFVELDVRNAQPLILAAVLRNPQPCATYIANAQHNGCAGRRMFLKLIRDVPAAEVDKFARLCEEGSFYEAFMGKGGSLDRKKVKREVYRDVFFGKPVQRGPISKVFEGLWPGVYGTLRALKVRFGYKIVSQILQRMESVIIIDGVCGRIVADIPGCRFATIHDAALVVAKHGPDVCRLIRTEFERYGVRAGMRETVLSEHHTLGHDSNGN